jgi:hypothetical protein
MCVGSESEPADFVCLKAFGAFLDFKLNLIAFIQGLEAFAGNGLEMYEHVFTALALDEAKTLGLIEPLYDSLFHGDSPFLLNRKTTVYNQLCPLQVRRRANRFDFAAVIRDDSLVDTTTQQRNSIRSAKRCTVNCTANLWRFFPKCKHDFFRLSRRK